MRFWRHLDLHLTLLIALTVAVLGVTDVVDAGVLAGATLATLGLVAAGTLRVRLQLADVAAALAAGRPSADRLLTSSTSGADIDLAGATDIRLAGVTLSRTLRNQLPGLRDCLRRGGTVRVAVIGEQAIAEAARRSAVPDAPEIFTHRLAASLDLLAALAAEAGPGRLQVRRLDFVPGHGLVVIDPAGPAGRLHVDLYSHRFGADEPTLALRAVRDPAWYRHFLAEFDHLWSAGSLARAV